MSYSAIRAHKKHLRRLDAKVSLHAYYNSLNPDMVRLTPEDYKQLTKEKKDADEDDKKKALFKLRTNMTPRQYAAYTTPYDNESRVNGVPLNSINPMAVRWVARGFAAGQGGDKVSELLNAGVRNARRIADMYEGTNRHVYPPRPAGAKPNPVVMTS